MHNLFTYVFVNVFITASLCFIKFFLTYQLKHIRDKSH